MDKPARCQLTTKDVNILEVMLHRHDKRDGPFVRLLRRKLSTATIVLHDAVDPRTATINSRIELSVDGEPAGHRLLVYGGEDAYPGMALPITTLRGLALLGLTAPHSVVCERSDGSTEELQLHRVLHQPEAARRYRTMRSIATAQPRSEVSVVTLGARRKGRLGRPSHGPPDPDGDDPGPQAA